MSAFFGKTHARLPALAGMIGLLLSCPQARATCQVNGVLSIRIQQPDGVCGVLSTTESPKPLTLPAGSPLLISGDGERCCWGSVRRRGQTRSVSSCTPLLETTRDLWLLAVDADQNTSFHPSTWTTGTCGEESVFVLSSALEPGSYRLQGSSLEIPFDIAATSTEATPPTTP